MGHNTNEGVMAYAVINKKQITAQCHALYGHENTMIKLKTEKLKGTDSQFYVVTLNNCV